LTSGIKAISPRSRRGLPLTVEVAFVRVIVPPGLFGDVTAISDQTHHEKAISKAQSRDHNVGTNQEHFHQ
jgi:hypothetical protein